MDNIYKSCSPEQLVQLQPTWHKASLDEGDSIVLLKFKKEDNDFFLSLIQLYGLIISLCANVFIVWNGVSGEQ